MSPERPKKGLAQIVAGKGRKANLSKAADGLMSNDDDMFTEDESDKENDIPALTTVPNQARADKKRNAAPLKDKRQAEMKKTKSSVKPTLVPLAKKKVSEAKKAESKQDTKPAPPAGKTQPGLDKAESSPKAKPPKKGVAPNETAAKVKASISDPELKPKALEKKQADIENEETDPKPEPKPSKKRKAVKDAEPEKPSVQVVAVEANKSQSVATSSETEAHARKLISKRKVPTDDQLANMPTHLRDYITQEKEPQVLMRILNNSNARRGEIGARETALAAKRDRAADVLEQIDISNEITALSVERKFATALSHLAHFQLSQVENLVEDAEMVDTELSCSC